MLLEWRTLISFNANAHRVSVSHSAHYMSDFNMSQVLRRWHNLCILWKSFAELFVFITFVKVMDLICNQLSLSGRGRELFRISSLKESVSVAVMVSRCLLKFCCCCLTVFHPLSVPCVLAWMTCSFASEFCSKCGITTSWTATMAMHNGGKLVPLLTEAGAISAPGTATPSL